ncbi:hypothetical protein AURDEDRAFT_177604 [Auricularia subglabra TFB-10046 SS5]|uniref:Uncharacterized protein n=1 Tax=Auricularia subglabra (strain TFB-10046 / SS5) TaxID=717982 RepID=J0WNA0_AURST|nr:hypothetical protein AURDEDRAFT_177604 [Auricularia subglabra TFB-10046 SS5]
MTTTARRVFFREHGRPVTVDLAEVDNQRTSFEGGFVYRGQIMMESLPHRIREQANNFRIDVWAVGQSGRSEWLVLNDNALFVGNVHTIYVRFLAHH